MIEVIKRILFNEDLKDLKKKIIFTLLLLLVCRIGAHIPVPGVNGDMAVQLFKQATGGSQNLFQLMDVFSGGAFAHMTIIALGVMPYISASIIIQLLTALVPSLQRDMKETPEIGKRKLGKWTRFLTVAFALFQSALFTKYAVQLNASSPGIIVSELIDIQFHNIPWLFYLIVMTTMTAGTMFLVWIGDLITERGIGNGSSLVITVGILASLPSTLGSIIRQLNLDSQDAGQLSFSSLIVLAFVFVSIIVGTILVIQGQRRIPIQHARRSVGDLESASNTRYLPLKINYAGVIPVIFASSLLMFPATIAQFLGNKNWIGQIVSSITPGTPVYTILYISLIIFFTYFWTATQFHSDQISSDMKKQGAFIPGVRQGKPTQDYIDETMKYMTFAGAIFLALIAVLPTLVSRTLGVDASISHFFGGTSLLILVGVVLDTSKKIETDLLSHRYDGFMKRGKFR